MRLVTAMLIAIALVSGLGGGATAQTPAAAGNAFYGWVVASQPDSAAYVPDAMSQFNSTGGENRIERVQTGEYRVLMPGYSAISGSAQVTTVFGDGSQTCLLTYFGPEGSEQMLFVRCFDRAGEPVDSYFMATFTAADAAAPAGDGAESFGAYLWAGEPAQEGSYTPDERFQYNSAGETSTVERTAVGTYTATLPGFTVDGGIPLVTAFIGIDDAPTTCTIGGYFAADESTLGIDVTCADLAGAAADSRFTLSFTNGNHPLGSSGAADLGSGYVVADDPTAEGSTIPGNQYSSSGEEVSVERTAVGVHQVSFPGLDGENGVAVVNAAIDEYCTVSTWGATGNGAYIEVSCFDDTGAAADIPFYAAWLSA